jgi:hypothetical protein
VAPINRSCVRSALVHRDVVGSLALDFVLRIILTGAAATTILPPRPGSSTSLAAGPACARLVAFDLVQHTIALDEWEIDVLLLIRAVRCQKKGKALRRAFRCTLSADQQTFRRRLRAIANSLA